MYVEIYYSKYYMKTKLNVKHVLGVYLISRGPSRSQGGLVPTAAAHGYEPDL